jgi:hypothetical protein
MQNQHNSLPLMQSLHLQLATCPPQLAHVANLGIPLNEYTWQYPLLHHCLQSSEGACDLFVISLGARQWPWWWIVAEDQKMDVNPIYRNVKRKCGIHAALYLISFLITRLSE